ncbi:TetR family transcriptional regulator [Bifidobacterium sp. DSM 109958]|uniref:TetR family transcriptional regulator n=1 Tax=Bifidobacterium moraviense TaxID=2675323 RepID=A0A7Y0F154_9BIFI|nr:TetR family transcriptional regulator [Bifidobacterium sp. DSM 109958]NMM99973.1 TetR family transcriptional regulator [Bifidobacterium sp. DSM 109958]
MTEDQTAQTPTRRYDPDRRQRIIDACLTIIAERGVAGTSHRVVAAAAGVPLGSMTYHFAGMGDLLHQAFDQFARASAARFVGRLRAAKSAEGAREAIVAYVEGDLFATPRDLGLTLELYTLAARDPAYRDITELWMTASRAELKRFFDPATSRMLDALIEGLALHRALGGDAGDDARRDIREAVRRIAQA